MSNLRSPLFPTPDGRKSAGSSWGNDEFVPSDWGFAGWGTTESVLLAKLGTGGLVSTAELEKGDISSLERIEAKAKADEVKHASLGPLQATSIAGNDLLSSCLYVGGICASSAGKMAPVSLIFVSIMLYFFRFVYGEVITAMPVSLLSLPSIYEA